MALANILRNGVAVLMLAMAGCHAPAPTPLPPRQVVCPPTAPDVRCPPLPEYADRTFGDIWADTMLAHGICAESLKTWEDAYEHCRRNDD